MNIQAMMKQAQKLQHDMMVEKQKIDEMEFEATSSFVTIKATGKKTIVSIKIDSESFSADDIEMLEDMLVVATNNVMAQIDAETEKRMGKYTQGMPGMF